MEASPTKLVGYCLLSAGIVIPLLIVYARYLTEEEMSWVRVTGKVLASRVEFKFPWEELQPLVEYIYEHNGIEYRGNKIRSHLIVYNFSGPAARFCARYPVGASVNVHVDPNNPSRSVLEPGGDSRVARVGFPLSLLLLILGALLSAT